MRKYIFCILRSGLDCQRVNSSVILLDTAKFSSIEVYFLFQSQQLCMREIHRLTEMSPLSHFSIFTNLIINKDYLMKVSCIFSYYQWSWASSYVVKIHLLNFFLQGGAGGKISIFFFSFFLYCLFPFCSFWCFSWFLRVLAILSPLGFCLWYRL